MSSSTVYVLVIALYYAAMVAIGLFFKNKIGNHSDYFVARGKLGPATIGFSFSATQMSGGTFVGAVGVQKEFGYNFVASSSSSAAAPWFSYILIGDRMRKVAARLKSVTIADIFEARYATRYAGLLATIIILISYVPMITAQFKAAGNIMEVVLGTPYWLGLVIFALGVMFYTVLGGMMSVCWAALVQGFIMISGFAILAPVAVKAAGGFSLMNQRYAAINPQGISLVGMMPVVWVLSSFLVWGFFQIGGSPECVTRFLIPENDRTLKTAMVYSIFFQSFVYLTSTLIAIAGGVLLPHLENADLTVPTLVSQLLPPLLGAIIFAAVMSAIMSTIDSIILVAGSLVIENIYIRFLGKAVEPRTGLRIARVVTLAVGLIGLVIALKPPAAILWIVTMSFSLLASSFTFPLLLGLWWPRATKSAGIAGMLSGFFSCIAWYVLGYVRYHSFNNWIAGIWPPILGSAISLAVMVVVSRYTRPVPDSVLATFFDDIRVD